MDGKINVIYEPKIHRKSGKKEMGNLHDFR
jgi:hypothetical protein